MNTVMPYPIKVLDSNYEMTPMDELLANACASSSDENFSVCVVETCCVNWRISAELVGQFIDDDNPDNSKFQYNVINMVSI